MFDSARNTRLHYFWTQVQTQEVKQVHIFNIIFPKKKNAICHLQSTLWNMQGPGDDRQTSDTGQTNYSSADPHNGGKGT